jgi:hypothetical protein
MYICKVAEDNISPGANENLDNCRSVFIESIEVVGPSLHPVIKITVNIILERKSDLISFIAVLL